MLPIKRIMVTNFGYGIHPSNVTFIVCENVIIRKNKEENE